MSEDSSIRTPCLETKIGSTQIAGSKSKPCVSELDPDEQNEQKTCSFTSTASNKDVKVTTSNKVANKVRWSFFEPFIGRTSEGSQNDTAETENVYGHPLVKRSYTELRKDGLKIWTEIPFSETGSESVRMADSSGFHCTKPSKKSLDMCTEIVGNESGN